MYSKIRVGIIGCGRMGTERATSCARLGAKVVVCVDKEKKAAAGLSALHSGSTWLCDTTAVPWDELDAIFVATPPSAHIDLVDQALTHRTAVLVEKPLGLNATEAGSLLFQLRSQPTINAVGYMNRYRGSVLKTRELVGSGKPIGIICHWASRRYTVPWWQDLSCSGGPFNEQATHIVDLCRFLLGEVESVKAISATNETRVAAVMQFKNASLGTLFYSCDATDKKIGIDILMEEGVLQLSGWDFALTANSIDGYTCLSEKDIFTVETSAFLDASTRDDQSVISCSFEDAYKTQMLVDAIRASCTPSTESVLVT